MVLCYTWKIHDIDKDGLYYQSASKNVGFHTADPESTKESAERILYFRWLMNSYLRRFQIAPSQIKYE